MDDRDDESPRSIFSALWFRALLTVLILGVLAAVAVPYVLDFATTPAAKVTPTKSTAAAPAEPVTAAPAATAPAETPATAAPATAVPAAPAPAAPEPTAVAPDKPETPTARPSKSTAAKPAPTKPAPTKSPTMVAKAAETPKPPARAAESEKPPAKATRIAEADKPSARASKAAEAERGTPKAAKPAEGEKAAPKAAEVTKPSAAKGAGGAGPYWVQVGAFKDPETAKRLAARLREQGMRVEESTATSGSARTAGAPAAAPRTADRYDVMVSGASAADVDARLAPKGLKGEATPNGVVVRPSLALREAVTLSRDLADAGLSVQVRRIGGPAPATAPTPAPAAAAPITLYRVRVGGFSDRAAAVDAMKRLEDKGLKTFLAKGNE
ncbi:MAG: hypothetical protein E6G48_00010 [Actinobacteria bacterium]|nr:MAG: hypothetical protein E6G48_00010 [Actinomycetota bacterium]